MLTAAIIGLAAGNAAFGFTPNAHAHRMTAESTVIANAQAKGSSKMETFTGTISKDGGQFVLLDDSSKASYRLDDQQTAEKFAGKKVRVKGVLDATNNTIRIETIEIATA